MDIRAAVTHQHYKQEYDFPEFVFPLFSPPRAIELIPEAAPRRCPRRKDIQSGLLVRLRRWAHHAPLPSIFLANVQSLDNEVDELRVRISFQRDIRDSKILFYRIMALSGNTVPVHTASWVLSTPRRQE